MVGQTCWMTKSQQVYPTDLNDTQWLRIQPYLPAEAQTGRPREHGWRVILNSIFYILQSGCSWRMLPSDLPPWQTVYHYFRLWRKDGLWERLNQVLREKVRRQRHKKKSQPSATILDSQSIKTSEGGLECGFDAGKKITGRKRHTLVDTLGLLKRRMKNAVLHSKDEIRGSLDQGFARLRKRPDIFDASQIDDFMTFQTLSKRCTRKRSRHIFRAAARSARKPDGRLPRQGAGNVYCTLG
jgi:transposase